MKIVFDILNRNVLVDVLGVLIISPSTAQLVFLLALKAKEVSVTSATIIPFVELLVLILRYRVRLLLTNIKNVSLRLKIFNAEIRCQNILRKLLLKLLFYFLAKFLVNKGVIGIQFCENDHFKTSDDSLFLKFEFLRNLHDFFIFHVKLVKIV